MKAILLLALLLLGCAEDRFLSKEEDEELRQSCEQVECVVVPVPVWLQIMQRLNGGTGI